MEILATEILTQKGRETVRNFYATNTTFLENHPEAHLKSLTYLSDKFELMASQEKKKGPKGANATMQNEGKDSEIRAGRNGYDNTGQNFRSNAMAQRKIDRYTIFNQTY